MITTTTSNSISVKPATGRRTRVSLGLMDFPSAALMLLPLPAPEASEDTHSCNGRRAVRLYGFVVRRPSGRSGRKPLVRRRDLRHQVLDQRLVGQRLERHLALGKARRAGVNRLAVDLDHAFLARVGIDAREADGEARILVHANPAQAVEHRLPLLERDLVVLVAPGRSGHAA